MFKIRRGWIMTVSVTINGEKRVFKNADNMRRYIMRFGDKTKRYTYKGTADEMFIDRDGVMFYDGKWKVKIPSTGSICPIDAKTGSFKEDAKYSVRYTKTGHSTPLIRSSDRMNDVIMTGRNALVGNRKAKVTVFEDGKKIGKVVARNNYPVWVDAKTKRSTDIYDGGWIPGVNYTPKVEKPKQIVKGWFVMGIPAGKKKPKYYVGEGFDFRVNLAYRFKTYQDAVDFIRDWQMYHGGYEGWEFFVKREY